MASRSPTRVMTQRLWSESISRSSKYTPSIFMAAMMASTLAGSRPSEKLGTHSTSVDISGKDSWRQSREAREGRFLGHCRSGTTVLARLGQAAGGDEPMRTTDHRDHVRGNDRDPTNIGVVHAGARARALNADCR